MDLNLDSILKTFRAESEDRLRNTEQAIIALESDPNDEEVLRTIFRAVHTIKGNASCMGLNVITDFSHRLEDLLELIRKGRASVNTRLVSLLLQSVDALKDMIATAVVGEDKIAPRHRAIMNRLAQHATRVSSPGETCTEGAIAAGPYSPTRPTTETQSGPDQGKSLRVDIERLDSLLNLTGEIAIARTRIRHMLEMHAGTDAADILDLYEASDRLHLELQDLVMEVRMIPLDSVFRQYIRMARDLARLDGKDARLVIEGGDAEVDTTLVEHLRDPLAQVIRNALDHGIESPEARLAKGKDPTGCITMRAFREAEHIIIQVEDDGAGLDKDRIVASARARGSLGHDLEVSDADVCRIILDPGFSSGSRDSSSNRSGMDLVRREIEALGGRITIDTREAQGTCVTIRVPLSLATVQGLTVGAAGETFVIPLNSVVECVDLGLRGSRSGDDSGVINLRGRAVPYFSLRKAFDMSSEPSQRESLVVLRNELEMAGVVVDDLFGEGQVVLKPLGTPFQKVPGLSGSTILGNGRVALILDVPALLRNASGRDAVQAQV